MRKVSDEEFKSIYEDVENQKIMSAVARKYKRYMDKDTLESNKSLAVLMSLQRFDSKKSNFKTFLWNGMRQQLLSSVRKNVKYNKKRIIYTPRFSSWGCKINSEEGLLDLIDLIKSIKNGDILIERYVDNQSVKDLSKKYNITISAVSNRIKIAKENLRNIIFSV